MTLLKKYLPAWHEIPAMALLLAAIALIGVITVLLWQIVVPIVLVMILDEVVLKRYNYRSAIGFWLALIGIVICLAVQPMNFTSFSADDCVGCPD